LGIEARCKTCGASRANLNVGRRARDLQVEAIIWLARQLSASINRVRPWNLSRQLGDMFAREPLPEIAASRSWRPMNDVLTRIRDGIETFVRLGEPIARRE
jgi:hypothetical protein